MARLCLYHKSTFALTVEHTMEVTRNRIQLNRRILTAMGALSVLPCSFELHGKRMNRRISWLRSTCWNCQLLLSFLYALYINVRLVISVTRRLDTIEHHQLGIHLTRAMLSANFSYWAYQIFVVYLDEQIILYDFAQSNPGEFLVLLH